MKARSDTERILDAYLAPEADRLADRVIDAALADIARTPQRRALRVPWRFPLMPALSRATGVAVVALVAVVGAGTLFYLNSKPDGGGSQGTPLPTATPTPAPTVAPTAAVIPPLPEGTLAAGTYRLRPLSSETMTIDVTVPDGGWVGGPPNAIGGPVGDSNGPNGVGVAFLKAQTINSDPCHWDKDGSGSAPQEGDIEVGPTVDDLAEALAANASYESTTPVEATLGGYSGKRLELQLVPDPSGCDTFSGEGDQYFVFGGRDGGQYAQGGANTWQVTIVDVEGTRLIAVLMAYEETSAADLSAAQGILESVVITP
jgi:hypothetical protein